MYFKLSSVFFNYARQETVCGCLHSIQFSLQPAKVLLYGNDKKLIERSFWLPWIVWGPVTSVVSYPLSVSNWWALSRYLLNEKQTTKKMNILYFVTYIASPKGLRNASRNASPVFPYILPMPRPAAVRKMGSLPPLNFTPFPFGLSNKIN